MRIRRVKKTNVKTASKAPVKVQDSARNERHKQAWSGWLQRLLQNPNVGFQLLVILLALASENKQMDRRLETVGTTAEKISSIAEVLTSTLTSVRAAAEGTKKIRQILE